MASSNHGEERKRDELILLVRRGRRRGGGLDEGPASVRRNQTLNGAVFPLPAPTHHISEALSPLRECFGIFQNSYFHKYEQLSF